MGEVAPLGDGEGRKNIKFHYFFGPSRTPVPTIYGFRASAVERTYFVGVGAHDDPEKQSIIAIQPLNAQCALKTSRWKFFGATFFSKKVAKKFKKVAKKFKNT